MRHILKKKSDKKKEKKKEKKEKEKKEKRCKLEQIQMLQNHSKTIVKTTHLCPICRIQISNQRIIPFTGLRTHTEISATNVN